MRIELNAQNRGGLRVLPLAAPSSSRSRACSSTARCCTRVKFMAGAGGDTRVRLGAVCEVFLIIANIGTAVVIY